MNTLEQTHKELFSLTNIRMDYQKGKFHELKMKVGKGKSRKGLSWAIETALKNDARGFIFVSSELDRYAMLDMVMDYMKYGEHKEQAQDLGFSLVEACYYNNSTQIVSRLKQLEPDYVLLLDAINFLHDYSSNVNHGYLVVEELERQGIVFPHVMVTTQLAHSFSTRKEEVLT